MTYIGEAIRDAKNISEAARITREYRNTMDEARKAHDRAKQDYAEAHAALYRRMDEEEMDGFKSNGVRFSMDSKPYAVIQDRQAFVKWATENHPELVSLKEEKALLNALVRECLDDNRDLPPGLGHYDREIVKQESV